MYTSASKSIGIDQLFHYIGCKYIDPNFVVDETKLNDIKNNLKENIQNKDKDNKANNSKKNKKNKIKLDEKKHKESGQKKKKCC